MAAIIAIGLGVVSVVLLLAWWARRKPAALESRPVLRQSPVGKCHLKTFRYADGFTTSRHSECGAAVGLAALTDSEAAKFHPEAALVAVTNRMHEAEPPQWQ